jgi:hypothetical protein
MTMLLSILQYLSSIQNIWEISFSLIVIIRIMTQTVQYCSIRLFETLFFDNWLIICRYYPLFPSTSSIILSNGLAWHCQVIWQDFLWLQLCLFSFKWCYINIFLILVVMIDWFVSTPSLLTLLPRYIDFPPK